jgi:hypothetical protein
VQLWAVPAAGFSARLVFLVNCSTAVSLKRADLGRGILFISANSSITFILTISARQQASETFSSRRAHNFLLCRTGLVVQQLTGLQW